LSDEGQATFHQLEALEDWILREIWRLIGQAFGFAIRIGPKIRATDEVLCEEHGIAFAPETAGTFAAACLSVLSGRRVYKEHHTMDPRRSRGDCIKGSLRPVSDRLWLMAQITSNL
jgi:hypothetical protein